jgi:hypothetical protein
VALYYEDSETNGGKERIWHFDLPFIVQGAQLKTLLLAIIIGALLAAPQAYAFLRLGAEPLKEKLIAVLISLLFNSAAAYAGASLLRRPF